MGALPGLPPAGEPAPAPAFFMPPMPAATAEEAAAEPAPVSCNPNPPPAIVEQPQYMEATPERSGPAVPFVPLGSAEVKEKKKKKKKASDAPTDGAAAKKPKKKKKEAAAGDAAGAGAAPVGSRALARESSSVDFLLKLREKKGVYSTVWIFRLLTEMMGG